MANKSSLDDVYVLRPNLSHSEEHERTDDYTERPFSAMANGAYVGIEGVTLGDLRQLPVEAASKN